MIGRLFVTAAICGLAAIAGIASAQSSPLDKLASQQILDAARAGKTQHLIVSFETGDIEDRIGKQRVSLHEARLAKRVSMSNAVAKLDEAAGNNEDANLLQSLHENLSAIKSSALGSGISGRNAIVRDFSHLSMAVVEVPDEASLLQLLSNPSIKRVSLDKVVKVSANWPSSYSDVTIVKSDIHNGVNGYKGIGTQVVVLDTAPFVSAITGFDDTKVGCPILYNGTHPTMSFLAQTGNPYSTNCRLWNYVDIVGAYDSCITPLWVDGSINQGCYHSTWQHGTAIDNVIARVAPAAYITHLQVVDSAGQGLTQDAIAGFNWVILNASQTPRIVAVNYSAAVVDSIYATSCPNSDYAAPISRLLNTYGILTVVPTGNDGSKQGVTEPACVPGVIAVGATTDSTTASETYSQYNGCTDPQLGVDQVPCFANNKSSLTSILAPGVNIGYPNELIPNDPTSVAAGSGTSLSAPHVAAAIAIIRGNDAYGASKTAAQVATMLTTTGPLVTDRNSTGIVKHRLDIAAAMGTGASSPPYPASLTMNPSSIAMVPNSVVTAVPTVLNQFGAPMSAPSWSLAWDSAVVNVSWGADHSIQITALAVGSTTVSIWATSTDSSHTARFDIPVTISKKTGINPPNCKTNPHSCA